MIEALGDAALLVRLDDRAGLEVNRRVHALTRRLRAAAPPWLQDCVPAYASLAIYFDPSMMTGGDCQAVVTRWLQPIIAAPELPFDPRASRLEEIPVCYGGEHGPDLDDVAHACGLDKAEVVALHTQPEYTVAMLGFSPGFGYLLGLDPQLEVARTATPRVRVPAGSVGIGGSQTGVYPDEGPGGWRLIGRTPHALFDVRRKWPSTLVPGDRVRFVAIDAARFDALRGHDR